MWNKLRIVASLGCALLLVTVFAVQVSHSRVDDSRHGLKKIQPVTKYVGSSWETPDAVALTATFALIGPASSGSIAVLSKPSYRATFRRLLERDRSPPVAVIQTANGVLPGSWRMRSLETP